MATSVADALLAARTAPAAKTAKKAGDPTMADLLATGTLKDALGKGGTEKDAEAIASAMTALVQEAVEAVVEAINGIVHGNIQAPYVGAGDYRVKPKTDGKVTLSWYPRIAVISAHGDRIGGALGAYVSLPADDAVGKVLADACKLTAEPLS